MRYLVLAALCTLGCNQSALTVGDGGSGGDASGGGDAALTDSGAIDLRSFGGADLGGFCGDPNSPRIEVNGMLAASPATTASALFLNCCDAAELQYISMQIPEPIVFGWRHNAAAPPDLPVTLDLANLPSSWSVVVYSRCSPTQPGCTPDDTYNSGLAGTLTVSRNGGGYQMSVCAEVSEPAGSPHPVVHTLRLWSPTITAQ